MTVPVPIFTIASCFTLMLLFAFCNLLNVPYSDVIYHLLSFFAFIYLLASLIICVASAV